jgi:hypothetical protein
MTNKIVDISDEIYRELGEPSDLSIASVAFWLRTNIGKLNVLLNKPYLINETTLEIYSSDETKDPFGINEKTIFKKIYTLYYYERLFRNALGAASTDSVIEIDQNGFRAKRVNKNELAKTYSELKKQADAELKILLDKYDMNGVSPLQVVGDDTIGGVDGPFKYGSSYIRNIDDL